MRTFFWTPFTVKKCKLQFLAIDDPNMTVFFHTSFITYLKLLGKNSIVFASKNVMRIETILTFIFIRFSYELWTSVQKTGNEQGHLFPALPTNKFAVLLTMQIIITIRQPRCANIRATVGSNRYRVPIRNAYPHIVQLQRG